MKENLSRMSCRIQKSRYNNSSLFLPVLDLEGIEKYTSGNEELSVRSGSLKRKDQDKQDRSEFKREPIKSEGIEQRKRRGARDAKTQRKFFCIVLIVVSC
jgi:hypothetical protein